VPEKSEIKDTDSEAHNQALEVQFCENESDPVF
jgi:hypothetical protein